MDNISLKTELRQELKLTPQLLQSMQLLQMNSQELLNYLNHVSEENPLIELGDALSLQKEYEQLQQKASWIDCGNTGVTFSHEEGRVIEKGTADRESESLAAFLRDQLDRRHLSKPLLALCRYMVELLDENGYWETEDLDSIAEMKIPNALIEQAIEVIQSLDPAGVGARNLSECLLLQIQRRKTLSETLCTIISECLPELSRKHYGVIAERIGVSVTEVKKAEKEISKLNPKPGQAFSTSEDIAYVRPDIFIVDLDGRLQVILNEYYLPQITINSYYKDLLQGQLDKETKEYLRQKMQQAKSLLAGLERRGSTLRRCAEAILAAQYDFFAENTSNLSPMILTSLAEELSLHPSTISRAIRGKYIQCRRGTFPVKYYFSHAVGPQECSAQTIRQHILRFIKEEDPHKPYSDQQLCELLKKEGIQVARRTIAKYRIELKIASSTVRKQ